MTALMIEAALRGLLFAAVVGAGLSLLRVKHVPARKAAWTLVLLASIAMPFLMRWPLLAGLRGKLAWAVPIRMSASVAPRASAPVVTVMAVPEAPAQEPAAAVPMRIDHSLAARENTDPLSVTEASTPAQTPPPPFAPVRKFTWPPMSHVVPWTYLAIASALLLRLILGLAASLRLWMTAEAVSPLIAPEGNVRASRRVASPVTVGSGIVLPADYPQWERSRLQMVLAHEQSHVRQMDFWLQMLAGLYTAAFWFSPLGWWLRRKLAQLAEAMSDRAGMEAAESGSEYAQVVLEFAALPRRRVPGVAMASAGNLSRRIDGLLNERRFLSAFAEGRRRGFAALLLIPAALFAATVLIRVPVASAQTAPAHPGPATAPAEPGPAPGPSGSGPVQGPAAAAAPRTGQAFAGQPPNAAQVLGPAPQTPPMPPPPAGLAAPMAPPVSGPTAVPPGQAQTPPPPPPLTSGNGQSSIAGPGTTFVVRHRDGANRGELDYHASPDGSAWAVASGTWSDANLPSSLSASRRAELERAHRAANGAFLWFTRNGKSYVVTDPAEVGRIEGMCDAVDALSQENFVQVPDLSAILAQSQAEMAKAEADLKVQLSPQAMARTEAEIKAAQAQFNPERMAQLQKQIQDSLKSAQPWLSPQKQAELQAQMEQVEKNLQQEQAHWNAQSEAEMQAKMAAMQKHLAEEQTRIAEAQKRWNAQEMQARMAEIQKRLAEQQKRMQERGIDPEVQRIIQQSLANGTARPVQ